LNVVDRNGVLRKAIPVAKNRRAVVALKRHFDRIAKLIDASVDIDVSDSELDDLREAVQSAEKIVKTIRFRRPPKK
jgi:ribosomal 50S subunit-associated protein YjgA (DUF615 family)